MIPTDLCPGFPILTQFYYNFTHLTHFSPPLDSSIESK